MNIGLSRPASPFTTLAPVQMRPNGRQEAVEQHETAAQLLTCSFFKSFGLLEGMVAASVAARRAARVRLQQDHTGWSTGRQV